MELTKDEKEYLAIMAKEQPSISGSDFDGSHTLTSADLEAIRKTIFDKAPITFMDTQKIVLENKELKQELSRVRGWLALMVDKVKDDAGINPKIDLNV